MAFTLALSDARTEVIHLAAIDGQSGSNARHSSTRLNAILNRKYRSLLSRAGQLGLPHGLKNGGTQTLGSVLSGEDFISVDVPSEASEVIGVDVRTGSSSKWQKLDPITWEQRRDMMVEAYDYRLHPGGALPSHGVGFWTMRQAPSVSGATLTAGKLAVWPIRLAGNQYQIHYVPTWTAITSDTHVFLLYEGWDEWLLNAAVMAITQRDTNKRDNFVLAQAAWAAADALLVQQASRLQRTGSAVPTPYGGINL